MAPVVLFDLPSKGRNCCWSLNPWKTRLILNYKKIDYVTEWVEYPDLESTLKPHIPARSEGMAYTSPTVKMPSGEYINDSRAIATALEMAYPSPPLHLDDPIVSKVEALIMPITGPLRGVIMPGVPRNLLNPTSAEYFERTRAVRFGMPLEQLAKEHGGERGYAEAEKPLNDVAALLKASGGPYFLGDTLSYADFYLVSFLQFCRRVDEEIFVRVCKMQPAFKTTYDKCEYLLKKDD